MMMFSLKMMNSVLKMMNFGRVAAGTDTTVSTLNLWLFVETRLCVVLSAFVI